VVSHIKRSSCRIVRHFCRARDALRTHPGRFGTCMTGTLSSSRCSQLVYARSIYLLPSNFNLRGCLRSCGHSNIRLHNGGQSRLQSVFSTSATGGSLTTTARYDGKPFAALGADGANQCQTHKGLTENC
jgi:hypothetical protein